MRPVIGISAVAALVYRAWSRKSLTPLGLVVAGISATAHAIHPWSAPFALLAVFYFGGTKATKVSSRYSIRTLDAQALDHWMDEADATPQTTGKTRHQSEKDPLSDRHRRRRRHPQSYTSTGKLRGSNTLEYCTCLRPGQGIFGVVLFLRPERGRYPDGGDRGVSASHPVRSLYKHPTELNSSNYAAVAADTYSSELGILSTSNPRLITSLNLREVPPGTNGGVTVAGLGSGLLGSFSVALTSAIILPFCPDRSSIQHRALWTLYMTVWGLLGSVLDSVLGGLLQASVVDKRSGKVVEGSGGRKVSFREVLTRA